VSGHHGMARAVGDLVSCEGSCVRSGFGDPRRMPCKYWQVTQIATGPAGFVHTHHRRAGFGERHGDREQERAAARDDDAAAGCLAAALDQCLGSAGRHHARKLPAGKRHVPVVRSSRDDDMASPVRERPLRDAAHDEAAVQPFDRPHLVARAVGEGPGHHRLVQPRAQPAEPPIVGTSSEVLAAGTAPGIQENDAHAVPGGGGRSREPGRTCADDRDVVQLSHRPSHPSSRRRLAAPAPDTPARRSDRLR